MAASPTDHPDRADDLSNLGTALQTRFERTGDLADLDEAITSGGQAVAATPADHPDRAGYLSNLGIALRTRFERTGDLADLDEAIARRAAGGGRHPRRPPRPRHVPVQPRRRPAGPGSSGPGDLADLDAAIDAGPAGGGRHPQPTTPTARRYLSNLGAALRDPVRADRATWPTWTTRHRRPQAVAATPPTTPTAPGTCPTSARSADPVRADRGRWPTWTRRSPPAGRRWRPPQPTTPTAPGTCPTSASPCGSGSSGPGTRPTWTRRSPSGRQAVAATPADHPDRAMYLSNLGDALRIRFERTGDQADLDAAIDRRSAGGGGGGGGAACPGGGGPGMGTRRRRWATMAGGRGGFRCGGRAAGAGGAAQPDPRRPGASAGGLEGLGADAAACCVHAGLTDRAVELFEQGRGVLLGQALDTRTDLTALTEQHPDLAARFTVLRDDLDRADDPAGPPAAMPTGMDGAAMDGRAEAARRDMERRRAAASAFDQVIAEIRQLPDFHGFLRPPPVAELLAAAAEGPVVVVTVSRFGSYALILTGSGVLDPVPLTGLTPETVYRAGGRLPRRARWRLVTGRRCGWPGSGRAAAE